MDQIPIPKSFTEALYCILIIIVFYVMKNGAHKYIVKLIDNTISRHNENYTQSFKNRFSEYLCVAEAVNACAERLMFETSADRISVFQYHNGGTNIAGVPFARFTLTHETLSVGVTSIVNEFQGLPIGIISKLITKTVNGEPYCVEDIENLAASSQSIYDLMKSINVKSMYVFPLFDLSGVPVGFVMASYIKNHVKLDDDRVAVGNGITAKMSGLLVDPSTCEEC